MSEARIVFLKKVEEDGNDFISMAEIFGDHNAVVEALEEAVVLEKTSLKAQGKLPEHCEKCHLITGARICQKGRFLFSRHCCGINGIITIEKIKGILFSSGFDVIEN